MKKIIGALIIGFIVLGAGSVMGLTVEHSGSGSFTLLGGAAPLVDSAAIYDPGLLEWPSVLDVNVEYWLYVNVSDQDTLDNIEYIETHFYEGYHSLDTSSIYHYAFNYTDAVPDNGEIVADANWAQIYPSNYASLQPNNATPLDNVNESQGVHSYIFSFKLDNMTYETDNWDLNVTVMDSQGIKNYMLMQDVASVNPYISMDFTNSTGTGYDFSWSGPNGALNIPDQFTTNVSSNGDYQLSIMRTGWFNHTTDPYSYDPIMRLGSVAPQWNVTNGTYFQFSNVLGPVIDHETTWNIYLDLPADLPQGSYDGVTIWILATNN